MSYESDVSGQSSCTPDPPYDRHPRFAASQVVRHAFCLWTVSSMSWHEALKCFVYCLKSDKGGYKYSVPERFIEPNGGEIVWDEERL